jgi:hypothetical protein
MTVEAYVAIYGEEYRRLITEALAWLDKAEPKWGLDKPIDRKTFMANLVAEAKKGERAWERAARVASNGGGGGAP